MKSNKDLKLGAIRRKAIRVGKQHRKNGVIEADIPFLWGEQPLVISGLKRLGMYENIAEDATGNVMLKVGKGTRCSLHLLAVHQLKRIRQCSENFKTLKSTSTSGIKSKLIKAWKLRCQRNELTRLLTGLAYYHRLGCGNFPV